MRNIRMRGLRAHGAACGNGGAPGGAHGSDSRSCDEVRKGANPRSGIEGVVPARLALSDGSRDRYRDVQLRFNAAEFCVGSHAYDTFSTPTKLLGHWWRLNLERDGRGGELKVWLFRDSESDHDVFILATLALVYDDEAIWTLGAGSSLRTWRTKASRVVAFSSETLRAIRDATRASPPRDLVLTLGLQIAPHPP
jgi:hypothetical protein